MFKQKTLIQELKWGLLCSATHANQTPKPAAIPTNTGNSHLPLNRTGLNTRPTPSARRWSTSMSTSVRSRISTWTATYGPPAAHCPWCGATQDSNSTASKVSTKCSRTMGLTWCWSRVWFGPLKSGSGTGMNRALPIISAFRCFRMAPYSSVSCSKLKFATSLTCPKYHLTPKIWRWI